MLFTDTCHDSYIINVKHADLKLKCPYYGLWKVHILECPTTGWHACKVKKHFHFLIVYIYFDVFWRSFFQTPHLHDANLQWLVDFVLKQCLWAFNAPKAAPSGKEWICIFIQTNTKIKFSQVCACLTSGRAICYVSCWRQHETAWDSF